MNTATDLNTLKAEAEAIRNYVVFSGEGTEDHSLQAQLQSEGAAALWHRIAQNRFGYLADEVGMGKTRQAMAVIATLFLRKPDARVVVLCPGKPLQLQWRKEWEDFVNNCMKINDGVLKSPRSGHLNMPMQLHERLNTLAKSLVLDSQRIHLLRYSSFSRPIGFRDCDDKNAVKQAYLDNLKVIGIGALDEQEQTLFNTTEDFTELKQAYNHSYAKRFASLIDNRPIDLIVCDEAQYLRHTDNHRNTNLKLALGANSSKWLFLSATPLHSGPNDIKSLDHYLCKNHRIESAQAGCQIAGCFNLQRQLAQKDVVHILDEFLVRRPQHYQDNDQSKHHKTDYRRYQKNPVDPSGDAFAAMITALVQMRMVETLQGNNNRFRQSECSSFESLARSFKNQKFVDSDGNSRKQPEMEPDDKGGASEQTIDRTMIDDLNDSFTKALGMSKAQQRQFSLPHSKLHQVADDLAERCLKHAPNHKTLVFVRRLDTVKEMLELLQQRFQRLLDERINSWANWLNQTGKGDKSEPLADTEVFWRSQKNEAEQFPIDPVSDSQDELAGATERTAKLPYFTSRRSKKGQRGLLANLFAHLQQQPDKNKQQTNPLAFLFKSEGSDKYWINFLSAIFDDTPPCWLSNPDKQQDVVYLKRCILQSMRHSDFLLDLYILHHFVKQQNSKGNNSLSGKLIWLFNQAKENRLNDPLNLYVNHWRARLRLWCEQFELVFKKCFDQIKQLADIDAQFGNMGPVAGRSGAMNNKHAVNQFKMPCYPNILICTDVLKEGVDLHLFCDEVIHYGVAWTSGDLEQRIGRVDRVNSLLGRKIAAHQGETQQAPKLQCDFPYLAGTLDQHQVSRVIKHKVVSDMRMDLGKRQEDIQLLNVDTLLNSEPHALLPTSASPRTFLPSKLAFDTPSLRLDSFAYHSCKLLKDLEKLELPDNFRALYPIAAIELQLRQDSDPLNTALIQDDNIAAKWCIEKKGRKYFWRQHRCCIVNLETDRQAIQAISMALDAICDNQTPGSLAAIPAGLPQDSPFEFSKQFNTLVYHSNEHCAPYCQKASRQQSVLLEQLGDFYLLRSPIVHIEAIEEATHWIARRNANLPFGYLNNHQQVIWYCCLFPTTQLQGEAFIKLLKRLAEMADRLQQLATADDAENWQYRSPSQLSPLLRSVPSLDELRNNKNSHLVNSVYQWQARIFDQVLTETFTGQAIAQALAEKVQSRLLRQKRLVKQGRATLFMPDEPVLRFKLYNYLDINQGTIPVIAGQGPLMCWQLAVNISERGRAPILQMDEWEQLPHSEGADYRWQKQSTNHKLAIYTWQDSNECPNTRYLALYHHALSLDGREKRLALAVKQVVDNMRRTMNFTKRTCAALLEEVFA